VELKVLTGQPHSALEVWPAALVEAMSAHFLHTLVVHLQ
jgi:hypothetical protein